MAERATVTMGWDVGDKFTDVCVLAPDAAILEHRGCARRRTHCRSNYRGIRVRWSCWRSGSTCDGSRTLSVRMVIK